MATSRSSSFGRRGSGPTFPALLGVCAVAVLLGLALGVWSTYSTQGYVLIGSLTVLVALGLLLAYRKTGQTYYLVLAAGLIARAVGSFLRFEVLFRYYGGTGDARAYFAAGLDYAQRVYHLDLSFLDVPGRTVWGTGFLEYVTGFVLALIGPSMRAAFLAFALLAFAGLVVLAKAAGRYTYADTTAYLTWLALWPSLAFWPASIGKEAMMVLGVGVAGAGYAAFPRPGGIAGLAIGLVLLGFVRPHVMAVTVLAMSLGALAARTRSGRLGSRYFQAPLWIGGMAVAWVIALNALSLESTSEVVGFVSRQAELTAEGGSAVSSIGASPLYLPLAVVSALFRPFIWEAGGITPVLSAIESAVLLVLVWRRRRGLALVLKDWRSSRLVAFSILFVPLYSVMLGYAMSNLGILARQRAVMLPFVLLLLHLAGRRDPRGRPGRAPDALVPGSRLQSGNDDG